MALVKCVFLLLLALCSCNGGIAPMSAELEKLGLERAEELGDLIPLEEKVNFFTKTINNHHITKEGLLSYRVDWPYGKTVPPAVYSDTMAWTSLWVVSCAYAYRNSRDPEALKAMERSLRGLDHLAKVTGQPGLLARTMVPIQTPVDTSAPKSGREWKIGKGSHRNLDYEKYYWKTDNAKAQILCWLFAVHLGLKHSKDEELKKDLYENLRLVTHRVRRADFNLTEESGEFTQYGDLNPHYRPPISTCLECFSFWPMSQIAVAPNALVSVTLSRVHDAHVKEGWLYTHVRDRGFDQDIGEGFYRFPGVTKYGNDHLSFLGALAITETSPPRHLSKELKKGLSTVWQRHQFDRNTLFTLVAHKLGLIRRRDVDARLNEAMYSLKVYPRDRRLHQVNNSSLREIETNWFNDEVSKTALPINLLGSSSFLWKSPPTRLKFFPRSPANKTHAPMDFLFAYWLWKDVIED